jgi:hypothetical protein
MPRKTNNHKSLTSTETHPCETQPPQRHNQQHQKQQLLEQAKPVLYEASIQSQSSNGTQKNSTASLPYALSLRAMTEHSIRAFFEDWNQDLADCCQGKSCATWEMFFEQYYGDEFELIRPSGNALDRDGYFDMLTNFNCHLHSYVLVSLDKIRVLTGGQSALVISTVDQSFTYMGKYNEDRAVASVVLELHDGKIKMAHEHRGTGRPIPKKSRWDTAEV